MNRIGQHRTIMGAVLALSYDEIAEILKLIDGSSCDELVVETGDLRLVVRRNSSGGTPRLESDTSSAASQIVSGPSSAAAPSAALNMPEDVSPSVKGAKPAVVALPRAPHQVEVVAPMVGTFYRAPAPDAPPFVEVGSVVRNGQPLCLIEVMKLFTTITSEHAGRVVQIGAETGALVEYGQTLFVIEPA